MTRYDIRWATAEDAYAYFGKAPDFSMQAIAVLEDDEVIGLGGIYYQGPVVVAFSGTKKCLDRRTIIKALKMFKSMLDRKGCRIYAVPESGFLTAPGFLKHCGFVPFNDTIYQYVGEG